MFFTAVNRRRLYTSLPGQGGDYLMSLGPAFYYPCKESSGTVLKDVSGNARMDLDLAGSYALTGDNRGLNLTGTSGVAEETGGVGLDSHGSYTAFCRMRLNSTSGGSVWKQIFGTIENATLGEYGFLVSLDSTGNLYPRAGVNNQSGSGPTVTASAPLSTGVWAMVGVRKRGTAFDVIVNGAADGTAACAATGYSGTTHFDIGGGRDFPSSYGIIANISHVAGYARALSDAELANVNTWFGYL